MTNEKWKELSAAEKRVSIAKDARFQLRAGRYEASFDTYADGAVLDRVENLKAPVQLQKLLKGANLNCECCAKGALMLSAVRKRNNCLVGGELGTNNFENLSDEIKEFSDNQWHMIEEAFMGWNFPEWQFKYPDITERLDAILTNIIKNKGTFKP